MAHLKVIPAFNVKNMFWSSSKFTQNLQKCKTNAIFKHRYSLKLSIASKMAFLVVSVKLNLYLITSANDQSLTQKFHPNRWISVSKSASSVLGRNPEFLCTKMFRFQRSRSTQFTDANKFTAAHTLIWSISKATLKIGRRVPTRSSLDLIRYPDPMKLCTLLKMI